MIISTSSNRSCRGHSRRRGAVLPLVTIAMVGLIGFVALAVDLGMLMIARNQCQNAADSAAIAGVRTINGDSASNYRISQVSMNAITAASSNDVLADTINADANNITAGINDTWTSGDVTIEVGSYTYDYNDTNVDNEGFVLRFPRTSTSQPYGAVRSTVNYNAGQYAFARVWGINTFNTGATATAVHRPRDVVIVMDLSGSMRFQSLPGTPLSTVDNPATTTTDESVSDPSSGSLPRLKSLNPESVFPKFGHYSDVAGAALQGNTSYKTGGGEFVDPGNISTTSSSGPAIAEYFYTDVNATTKAFSRASDSFQTTPGGDNHLRKSLDASGSDYAKTLREVLNTPANKTDATWENTAASRFGYNSTTLNRTTFNGFTQGPGYWGKTFAIWPPDPGDASGAGQPTPANYANNGARDWRQRFFLMMPALPSFSATVEQTPGNIAPNRYSANTTDWMRIINLPAGQLPEVGDTVSITNSTNQNVLYTVVGVRASTRSGEGSTASIKEVQLNKPLRVDVTDTGLVAIQFRRDAWLDENQLLWDSTTGELRAPGPHSQAAGTWNSSTNTNGITIGGVQYFYRINYAAIISWLQNTGTNPFPSSLRGGGLLYYSAFPDTTDTTLNDRMWSGDWTGISGQQARNEQFWRNYIDFVLGVKWRAFSSLSSPTAKFESYTRFNSFNSGTPANSVPMTAVIGNGAPFNWGGTGFKISAKPTVNNVTAYMSGNSVARTVGATSMTVSSLSPNTAPRAGDIVQFASDTSNIYTVAATPTPTTTSFTITSGLINAVANNTAVTFKQVGYMNYDDNPLRFRHQFWFGPMTMIDFLGNYNTGLQVWPGNVPEAQSWACKMGIQVAIQDIQTNHPNDFIGTVYFSSPKTRTAGSSSAPNGGQHNRAKVQLRSIGDGNHFNRLKNALWFSPMVFNQTVTEIAMYDTAVSNEFNNEVPRANGGTAYAMGFMLAYNQMSSSRQLSDLRLFAKNAGTDSNQNAIVGGASRKGSQKMIVFESDGAPNTAAVADFVNKTSTSTVGTVSNDSYYKVRIYDNDTLADATNEYPKPNQSYTLQGIYDVVDTITNLETHSSLPGFSTARRPVLIHTIGYGTLFSPTASGTTQTNALTALQTIQFKGKTATNTNPASFPTSKRIFGTTEQRITAMKDAFTAIMQDGVSVTLIR